MLVHEDDIENLRVTLRRTLGVPGGSTEFSFRVRHVDGDVAWLEGLATNLLDDPAVAGMVINARDVTARRARLERQAAISDLGREVLRATTFEQSVESAAEVIIRIVHASDCRIVSVGASVSGNQPGGEEVDPAGAGGESAAAGDPPTLRLPVGDPDQPLAFIEVFKDMAATRDDEVFVELVAGIVLASTVRFGAEDAIRHQAMHDPLTGLPDRALFNDRLQHALSRHACGTSATWRS